MNDISKPWGRFISYLKAGKIILKSCIYSFCECTKDLVLKFDLVSTANEF